MIYRAYPFTNNRCNSIIPNFSFELFLLVELILQIQDRKINFTEIISHSPLDLGEVNQDVFS